MVRFSASLLGLGLLLACDPREGTVFTLREGDASLDAGALPIDAASGDVLEDAGSEAQDAASDAGRADASDAATPGTPGLPGMCRISGAMSGFYETFGGSTLSDTWLLAHGQHTFAGRSARGGFVRDNVAVQNGDLVLSVRGDRYSGQVRGIEADGSPRVDGKRSAAAVVTRDLFASGTYQVEGRFVAPAGVEVAVWVMADDDRAGGIDIAVPGLTTGPGDAGMPSYAAVRMRARSSREASAISRNELALAGSLDDGQPHILRFDWYAMTTPSAQFWVDDIARWSTSMHVPSGSTRRLWIVAWVPDDTPADFDTAEVRIQNAFVTPFGNTGDRCAAADIRSPGLVAPR